MDWISASGVKYRAAYAAKKDFSRFVFAKRLKSASPPNPAACIAILFMTCYTTLTPTHPNFSSRSKFFWSPSQYMSYYSQHSHPHHRSHREQLIACYAIEGDLDSISSLNGGAIPGRAIASKRYYRHLYIASIASKHQEYERCA